MSNRGVSLGAVVRALGQERLARAVASSDQAVLVDAAVLVEPDDVAPVRDRSAESAELWLMVGVDAGVLGAWLAGPDAGRVAPRAVMTKVTDAAIGEAAERAGIALIVVRPDARWDRVFAIVRRTLDRSASGRDPLVEFGSGTDLFELAQDVATHTRGMVTVEDEDSRVLAYSASGEAADELRRRSILGREGPREYLRKLQEWGVFDRLRRSDDVIEVPAHDELSIRRRLVVPIRRQTESTPIESETRSPVLGTIWVQEGSRPLASDAVSVLSGAAAVAARLISRMRDAPDNEALQIQQLLGVRGGGADVPSLAAGLSIPATGPAVVIGVAGVGTHELEPLRELTATLRLRAGAFHRASVVTAFGGRIYVLLPQIHSLTSVLSWSRDVMARVDTASARGVRAVVSSTVDTLADVSRARAEVDRVLDGTDGTDGTRRVTTLADSRTEVLLGEILTTIAQNEQLWDPRIAALDAYDRRNSSTMRESAVAYLAHSGDVRRAAQQLGIHPNTVRYRIKRVEEITDTNLSDPACRLLLEIQLAMTARASRTAGAESAARVVRSRSE